MPNLIPSVPATHPTGLLNLQQRMRLTAMLLAARWVTRRQHRRNTSQPHRELDNPKLWQAIQAPSGPLAERAWTLARAHQPDWLIQHSLRTHAWSMAFGVIGGLSPHREALFAAAMLHDAGLTPIATTPSQHCFAVRGARYAQQALRGAAEQETLNLVAEAIVRHLDFRVDAIDGVEAHLLQAGAMADVLGSNVRRIPQAVRDQVLSSHPRLGMKEQLCRCMTREAAAAPHSRVGCYVRQIDFLRLIRQAPFEE